MTRRRESRRLVVLSEVLAFIEGLGFLTVALATGDACKRCVPGRLDFSVSAINPYMPKDFI